MGVSKSWDAHEGDDEGNLVEVAHDEDGIRDEAGLHSEVLQDNHRVDSEHILGEVDDGSLDYYYFWEGHLLGRRCRLQIRKVAKDLPLAMMPRELAWYC